MEGCCYLETLVALVALERWWSWRVMTLTRQASGALGLGLGLGWFARFGDLRNVALGA